MQMTMIPTGNGGARPGAGRPSKATIAARAAIAAKEAPTHDPFGPVGQDVLKTSQVAANFANSRATVEAVKAKQAELSYRANLGRYVDREAVKLATAQVMASFAQGMRTLQDDLERRFNLDPLVVEGIGETVDAQLAALASGFELMLGGADAY